MADKRITDFTESVSAGADYYLVTDSLNDGVKKIKTSNIVSKTDLGLGNVDNTSDVNKPISTATQTALDLKLPKAGGTMTGGITVNQTGHHYAADGAIIHRLADRVFIGDATANTGENVTSQPDWLTQFELGNGRVAGFIHLSQGAILNGSDPSASNAFTVGSQTQNITLTGLNSIGSINIGVNNNSTVADVLAFASYNEAYRMSGALGGAYGYEIDTVNYASTVTINPFLQDTGQLIGLQLAAGAGLSSTGQFPSSAAINIRNNNSTFKAGLIFGNDAIDGTDGSTGQGEAIAMVSGHAINYYYGSGAVNWQLYAGFGANGDYTISTSGTGALATPRVATDSVKFPATQVPSSDVNTLDDYEEGTFTPVLSFGGASTGITYSKQVGKYTKIGNVVYASLEIILTSKGSATGALNIAGLPFPVTATLSPTANARCANLDSSFSSQPAGIFVSGQSNVNLAKIVAGAGTGLTDTDITNTTVIRVSGHYFVD